MSFNASRTAVAARVNSSIISSSSVLGSFNERMSMLLLLLMWCISVCLCVFLCLFVCICVYLCIFVCVCVFFRIWVIICVFYMYLGNLTSVRGNFESLGF